MCFIFSLHTDFRSSKMTEPFFIYSTITSSYLFSGGVEGLSLLALVLLSHFFALCLKRYSLRSSSQRYYSIFLEILSASVLRVDIFFIFLGLVCVLMKYGTSWRRVSFSFLQSSVISSYQKDSQLLLSLLLLRILSLLFLSLYFLRLVVILLSILFSCYSLYRTHSSMLIYFMIISDCIRLLVCQEVIIWWIFDKKNRVKVGEALLFLTWIIEYQICLFRNTWLQFYHSIQMGSEAKIVLFLSMILLLTTSYDIDCHEIGTSAHGVLKGCSILHDPLPLKWQAVITLYKDYEWHGQDDVFYIYSDGTYPKTINCTSASNLPGPYKAGQNITIQHTCYSFKPALKEGDQVSFWAFNAHTSKFDDPLIFQFKIPVPKAERRDISLEKQKEIA